MIGEQNNGNKLAAIQFTNPPVIETALSVQFSGLNWQPHHPAIYYQQIRDRFPKLEMGVEIPPIVETFPQATPKEITFRLNETNPPTRSVFLAENEAQLIQIQSNRFVFNWRNPPEDQTYPSFNANFGHFQAELQEFLDFCIREDMGTPKPNFCEVVYVNRVSPEEGETWIEQYSRMFSNVVSTELGFDAQPELVTFRRTFVLGDQLGRLYFEAGVAEKRDAIQFKLTSRIRIDDGDMNSAVQAAHDFLIEAFLNLTEDEIRKDQWGQANA